MAGLDTAQSAERESRFAAQRARTAAGRASAREWRARNIAKFDAIYGASSCC